MAFSTILGLASVASSFLGARNSSRQADRANDRAEDNYALQQEQLEMLREQMAEQQRYAQMSWDMMLDENEYQRQWEQTNRLLNMQEREFELANVNEFSNRNYDAAMGMYRDDVARQVEADREAARMRAFRLNQLLQNQQITESERQFAIQQLQQAQSIAAGERDQDLFRFYQERAQAGEERDYMLGQFGEARSVAQQEKDLDLQLRDQMMQQIASMQGAVQSAASQLGVMPDAPQMDPAELEAEIMRRTSDYQSDVDRAADRIGSVNEANLIRAGMDASTPGNARRSEVASRMASEYKDARNRAYQDALNYISGKQDMLMRGYGADMDRRGAMLAEAAGVAGTGLQDLRSLPGYQSEMNAFNMLSAIPSAVYSRNIGSANNYATPVGINSGIYDRGVQDIGPAMSQYQVNQNLPLSALSGILDRNSVRSGIYEPTNLAIPSASGYFTNAINTAGNLFSNTSTLAQGAWDRANNANIQAGNAWGQAGSSLTRFMNDWWSNNSAETEA